MSLPFLSGWHNLCFEKKLNADFFISVQVSIIAIIYIAVRLAVVIHNYEV